MFGRHHFEPKNIYIVEETGCTNIQKPPKVLTKKIVKQVGSITSQERGTLITMYLASGARGNNVPSMLIFPLAKYHDHFINDGPPGCHGAANKSDWMNKDGFIKYFANYAKPLENSRALIILDKYYSHLYLPVISFCRDYFLTLLSFSFDTFHTFQPPDHTVFGPLKKLIIVSVTNE